MVDPTARIEVRALHDFPAEPFNLIGRHAAAGCHYFVISTISPATRFRARIRSAAEQTSCSTQDALAVMGLLSSGSAGLLKMEMQSTSSEGPRITQAEFGKQVGRQLSTFVLMLLRPSPSSSSERAPSRHCSIRTTTPARLVTFGSLRGLRLDADRRVGRQPVLPLDRAILCRADVG
jgi:hypothetical protein